MVVECKALACELPARLGLPLSRFHIPDLRAELIGRGIVATISDKTIWRWLAADAIRPWAHRSWIFPRDPDFQAKASRVLDLYARRFEGTRLRPNEYVISADEKTSIQARHRRHLTRPASPRHPMLIEHEYQRRGALAYLAAWDVHRAKVFGRLEPKTGIKPFGRLVTQVMQSEPYCSAKRVFWIVDNGSSHRGRAAASRLQRDYPNLTLVHLPLHASWLNQIEIYFSIVERKVLRPNDFSALTELAAGVLGSRLAMRTWPRPSSGSPPGWTWPSSSAVSAPRTYQQLRWAKNTSSNLRPRALSYRHRRRVAARPAAFQGFLSLL